MSVRVRPSLLLAVAALVVGWAGDASAGSPPARARRASVTADTTPRSGGRGSPGRGGRS